VATTLMAHKREHHGPETPEEYFAFSEVAVRSAYDTLDRCLKTHGPGPIMFAEGFLAGLILQAAHMAIRLYSPPRAIPCEWQPYIKQSHDAARFCIGPPKHGVPTGLIIYAGRNQFAHWDEPQKHNPVVKRVFQLLANAFDSNLLWDMVFELETGVTASFCAGPVLFLALEWKSYDVYLAEMTAILAEACISACVGHCLGRWVTPLDVPILLPYRYPN
jgi:hypothetical protein